MSTYSDAAFLDDPIRPDPAKEHDAALAICGWAGDADVAREVLAVVMPEWWWGA